MPRQAEWNTPRGGTQQRFFFLELTRVAEIEPTTVAPVKTSTKIFTAAGALVLPLTFAIVAGTPEQEKAFTDKHNTAMEGKDTATLSLPLHTRFRPGGARVLQNDAIGGSREKLSRIELNLTREDVKKATTRMDGSTGKVCLNLKRTKNLLSKG